MILDLTMDNLEKAKVGDLLQFSFSVLFAGISNRKVTMRVINKTEDEILLDETDILFDYQTTENMQNWEESHLCNLLNKIAKYLPVEAECSILSREEIQDFVDRIDRIKFDENKKVRVYWTKSDAGKNHYCFVDEQGFIAAYPTNLDFAGVSISIRVKLPKEKESMMSFEEAVKKLGKELGSLKVSDYVASCFECNEIGCLAAIHPHFNELCTAMASNNKATAAIKFAEIYNEILEIEMKFELTEIGNMPVSKWITENLERIETQIQLNENDRDDECYKKLDWNKIGEEMASVIASVRTTNKMF